MKFIYRILVLAAIFVASLFIFAKSMPESVFSYENKATDMNETTLPVIYLQIGEVEINRLHGYSSNLDEMLIRESITPITSEQSFTVLISEGSYDIRKINYELTDAVTGNKIESGSVISLNKEGKQKEAKIKIKEVMTSGTEYIAKITLISNESKRIYYYTRLIMINEGNLEEKIAFVKDFHQKTLDKDPETELKKYLEYQANTDNSSYARINIYSSHSMICYGALDVEVIYEELPLITEFSKDTASVVLSFYISIPTDSGVEYYNVKEHFRFLYTSQRVYLYNYEREMEAIFQPELVSLKKNEFKLGITGEDDIEFITNTDKTVVAFVRNRELWSFHYAENKIVKVFSFGQENTDYIRDTFEQHDIKIMNVDPGGNIDFMVYGYMNRGEYEGRVGIVIYHFDKILERISEQMYLPVNTTYQMLKDEIGHFAYRNRFDVVYFTVFQNIYSYNFASKVLTILASDLPEEAIVFSMKEQYAVWQNTKERADFLTLLLLETGEKKTIYPGEDEYIKILGRKDENFIYGLVKKADVAITNIGNTMYPMHTIFISNKESELLREYHKDGFYVIDAIPYDNIIDLDRVTPSNNTYSGYIKADSDSLLNKVSSQTNTYGITTRVTNLTLMEYYISLPSGFIMEKAPEIIIKIQNTVIMDDTTVRITKPDSYENRYFTYSFGRLLLSTTLPGDAIQKANESVGTVLDSYGKIVWQRGIKASKAEITGILPIYVDDSLDSVQAVLKMLFAYKSVDVNTGTILRETRSVKDSIESYLKIQALDLSGVSLDEVLYMVWKGRPVIGMLEENKAVLIIGYDSNSVTFIDPVEKKTVKLPFRDAETAFLNVGNVFLSYMD